MKWYLSFIEPWEEEGSERTKDLSWEGSPDTKEVHIHSSHVRIRKSVSHFSLFPISTMQFESGISSWSQLCNWRSSWRGFAIKNVILSSLTYLPILFLFYCAIKHPKTFSIYKVISISSSIGSLSSESSLCPGSLSMHRTPSYIHLPHLVLNRYWFG